MFFHNFLAKQEEKIEQKKIKLIIRQLANTFSPEEQRNQPQNQNQLSSPSLYSKQGHLALINFAFNEKTTETKRREEIKKHNQISKIEY